MVPAPKRSVILEKHPHQAAPSRYNFNLRDDKNLFSLRMDMTEEFPASPSSGRYPDGARYFGPYASASAAREVLKELCKIFPCVIPSGDLSQAGPSLHFHQISNAPHPATDDSPGGLTGAGGRDGIVSGGEKPGLLQVLKKRMGDAALRNGMNWPPGSAT